MGLINGTIGMQERWTGFRDGLGFLLSGITSTLSEQSH